MFACFAFSSPAIAQNCNSLTDKVDDDCDGLIDIDSLEKLNNIRYSLDGTSYKTSPTDTGVTTGCPENVCKGYELVADLDFDIDGNERIDKGDAYWRDGEGWEPIPNGGFFSAIFEGNQHTISNLFIDERINNPLITIGLFSTIIGGEIRNLRLVNADVTADSIHVGALAGWLIGEVTATYMTGRVINNNSGASNRISAGGLLGRISGETTVTASYVVATVSADRSAGGLVGDIADDTVTPISAVVTANYAIGTVSGNANIGGLIGLVALSDSFSNQLITVTASYAVATVSGIRQVGGLVGQINSSSGSNNKFDINDSYFDTTVSGLTDPPDQARSTEALQTERGYRGIYANWNVDINNDGTMDDPWHFGSGAHYPALVLPQITSGASAGGCPTVSPANFPEELLESSLAGLLEDFTITPLGNLCLHQLGSSALRLKLRVFLESALP